MIQNKTTNISLILLTKNESQNIEKNFDWLKKCHAVNEIVVVDDYSTDETVATVKKLSSKYRKVKVFTKKLEQDFASQRNFAISKTTNNWILWVDADEKPSKKLIRFINHFDKKQYKAYAFKRQDIFLGHVLKHGENFSLNFTRLFSKNYGSFYGRVHEVWKTKRITKNTNLIIYHYSHQTVKSLVQKINFYTDIRAQELFNKGIKTNMFQIIFYPIGKFFQNYFFRLGFLDGTPGIIMSLCMSFHVFLNKSKLLHLYKQQS